MGWLDRLESAMDRLEGKVDKLESEVDRETRAMDPSKPLKPWVSVLLVTGNVVFAGGLYWLFETLFVVLFVCGLLILAGVGLLFGPHPSHKLTGALMTAFNLALAGYAWFRG